MAGLSAASRRVCIGAALALLLAGCSQGLLGATAETAAESFSGCMKREFGPAYAEGQDFSVVTALRTRSLYSDDGRKSVVNGFLDCYFEIELDSEPGHDHARLLRGHIVTMLLAQYGNEIANRFNADPAAARGLLLDIREAEDRLRQSSPLHAPAVAGVDPQEWRDYVANWGREFYHVDRIERVFRLSVAIEEIAFKGLVRDIGRVAAAVSAPLPSSAGDIVKVGIDRLRVAARVAGYGNAMRLDGGRTLKAVVALPATDPSYRRAWRYWDTRLALACADLAHRAQMENFECVSLPTPP